MSVVGSRKASGHAMRESFALGKALAEAGFVVVSGGAFGCDIAAHHGVLAASASAGTAALHQPSPTATLPRPAPTAALHQPSPTPTLPPPPASPSASSPAVSPAPAVCIFAGGLSSLYPRANLPVFRRLWRGRAALVSERLWESPCRPADFAARNRLIAGLSPLTVVMQAALRSGAMVTARLALDSGRQVAVLRHPPGDVRADGSAALLDAGAPGFADALELLAGLALAARSHGLGLACRASGQQPPQGGDGS